MNDSSAATPSNFWRKCSSCKREIGFNSKYFECSVSTCTGLRTGYVFCSVPCWEVHLPGAKHRDAGAIEKRSPSSSAASVNQPSRTEAPRRIISTNPHSPLSSTSVSAGGAKSSMSQEVLVVVSKMKQYIKETSSMNTSEDVNQILSDRIRQECDRAIERARADGRKTVMARDFIR